MDKMTTAHAYYRQIIHEAVNYLEACEEGIQGVGEGRRCHRLLLWLWRICGETFWRHHDWGLSRWTSCLAAQWEPERRQLPTLLWQLFYHLSSPRHTAHTPAELLQDNSFKQGKVSWDPKEGDPGAGWTQVCQRRNLVASVWMDKKPVTMLSTLAQADATQTAQRRQKNGMQCCVALPCISKHLMDGWCHVHVHAIHSKGKTHQNDLQDILKDKAGAREFE